MRDAYISLRYLRFGRCYVTKPCFGIEIAYMKLCNRKFPRAGNYLQRFSGWIFSLVIHEKRFFFMRAWRWRLAETAKVVLHNVSLVLGHKFIVVLQLFGRGRWASITASKSLNASLVSLCFFTKHKNNLALSNTNSGSNTDFLHLDKNPQTYTNRKTNKYRVAIAILLCWQNSSVNSTTTEVLSTSFPGQGPRSGFSSGGANANAQAWAN